MRAFLAVVATFAVVLVAMAATGRLGETIPVAATPASFASPTPAPTRTAAPTATPPRAITLTFTEQDLTKAAQEVMPLKVSGITVTDPRIRLDAGRLTLNATGRAFFVSGAILVVASPEVANGTASAKIEKATFAGIGLPDSTKRDVADTFARVLAANVPPGARVISVNVNTGTLVVQAIP